MPFFLTYVKRGTDVRNRLSGHRLFANPPADTVRPLPSDRRLTLADNTRQRRRTRDKSDQETRAIKQGVWSGVIVGPTCA